MKVIAPAMFGAILLTSAAAATAAPGAGDVIEEILVVGARLPRPVQDVVGTVDVITRDALIDQIAVSAEDIVRYLPGVSVARADTRFGATEFTIRGLSGNRVTTLIDAVPVADQFDIGAFANAGQDYLIADAVSRIEILRGPASTLFGSDALGGVVAVVTRDPEEYLRGKSLAVAAAGAYSGADQARLLNASVAGRSGAASGVLHTSYLGAEQRDSSATSQEEPLDRDRGAVLAKLVYVLPGGNRLQLKGEAFEERVTSRPEAVLGFGRQFRNTTFLEGDDRRTRRALQVDFTFAGAGGWLDDGRVIGYAQRSRTDQRTRERRELLDPPVAIERRFDYQFDDVGALLDLESRFEAAGVSHRLGWGASLRRTRVEELRDGLERNLSSGAVSNVLLGETLPVRDFPNSTVLEAAVYLHDEVSLGPVTLIPGVRFEHYRLDADTDAVYRADFPDTPAVNVSESALAPRFGVQWRLTPRVDLFAQYAHGFRAPPFEDVNIGLDYSVPLNVRAIANPDLRSETSEGLELGVRYRGEALGITATLFGADYNDFIESKARIGVDPASGTLLFQSRNIERARIYGAELSVSARLTPTLDLQAVASWTRGENRVTDAPLATVDPPTLMTRLIWQPAPRWRSALALRAAGRNRVDDSQGDLFDPDAYALLDLTVGYAPSSRVRIDLGVFNVTDRSYWDWASVRGRPADDPLVDLLAGPGRYGALSLRLDL